MYEKLMMIKPGKTFSPKEMAALVRDVCDSGDGEFEQDGSNCIVSSGDAYLEIWYNADETVAEEAEEIAGEYGLPCQECTQRWEMEGEDPDGELFNDHLLIAEKLYATGKFVIFDPIEEEEFTA